MKSWSITGVIEVIEGNRVVTSVIDSMLLAFVLCSNIIKQRRGFLHCSNKVPRTTPDPIVDAASAMDHT